LGCDLTRTGCKADAIKLQASLERGVAKAKMKAEGFDIQYEIMD
jgi:hypothetical protein